MPYQPVTPDKIKWLLRIQKGQIQPVPDPEAHDWFDAVTRDPLLWYYTDGEGAFHFFDGPGFAPATGDELKPVTPDLRRFWEARNRERASIPPAPAPERPADRSGPPAAPVRDSPPPSAAPPQAPQPPVIVSFESVPASVDPCKVAILRWTVGGAASVSILPGIGAVNPATGYKVVRPAQTTQYTLEARSNTGLGVSREVTLSVSSAGRLAVRAGPK